VGDVGDRVESSPYPLAVVVSDTGIVLGRLGADALASLPDLPVEDVMQPGPTTIRPHLELEEVMRRLRRNELEHGLVTSPYGRLIGVIARADVERRL
jgi:CBS domain-containing protein